MLVACPPLGCAKDTAVPTPGVSLLKGSKILKVTESLYVFPSFRPPWVCICSCVRVPAHEHACLSASTGRKGIEDTNLYRYSG